MNTDIYGPISAQAIADIPPYLGISDWGWYHVIGGQERMIKLWQPHFDLALDTLQPFGWLGASLFLDRVSLARSQNEASGLTYGSKIYWRSEADFKNIRNAPPDTPAGVAWAIIVKDLQDKRWKSLSGRRWDVNLLPEMHLLAGDQLPQAGVRMTNSCLLVPETPA